MKRTLTVLVGLALLAPLSAVAQQEERYDYWQPQRDMIRRGQQAIFMCNGLFTSNRSLESVVAQELAFLPEVHPYESDQARRAVIIGTEGAVPVMRAAVVKTRPQAVLEVT